MAEHPVNQKSTWPSLEAAVARFTEDGPSAVPDGTFTIIADRVRAAIESSEHNVLNQTASALEQFFRTLYAAAPIRSQDAVRRKGDADTSAAYLLGQAAFAHLVAARTFDLRVDDSFLRVLQDARYNLYLRALLAGPKDGITLTRAVGETKETVSRKLGVLRGRGVIFSRKEGTTVVNSLSPPALAFLQHLGVTASPNETPQQAVVSAAIAEKHQALPDYLKRALNFGPQARAA